LIQASASRPTQRNLDEIGLFARTRGVELPEEFDRGGIVGTLQLDDCVTTSPSKWFEGPVGWVLSKSKRLPFIPLKGKLGCLTRPEESSNNCVAKKGQLQSGAEAKCLG
jgi:hypothetical protein